MLLFYGFCDYVAFYSGFVIMLLFMGFCDYVAFYSGFVIMLLFYGFCDYVAFYLVFNVYLPSSRSSAPAAGHPDAHGSCPRSHTSHPRDAMHSSGAGAGTHP